MLSVCRSNRLVELDQIEVYVFENFFFTSTLPTQMQVLVLRSGLG